MIFTDEPPFYKVEVEIERKRPDAVCECGNKSFYVSFGNFMCIGKCTVCGVKQELYPG